ncbi:MAG: type II toxin-antitoxin system HicA family toxin [Candidatus Baltobacteraceae bacterium]
MKASKFRQRWRRRSARARRRSDAGRLTVPSKPPVLTVRDLLQVLERAGFELRRQTGSHAIYRRGDGRFANIPIHTGDIPPGTLRVIMKTTGLKPEDLR